MNTTSFTPALHRTTPGLSLVIMTVMVATLGGCGPAINVPPLKSEELAGLRAHANLLDETYRIEPGDTVRIRYPFHQEMDQEVVVQPDGSITATRVGPLTIAGLTSAQLENLLKTRTSDRLRDPEVVVSIARYSDKAVYVGGEVGKPGMLPYRKGLTPLQAVIAAGGFLDTARTDSVILVRGGTENGFIARKLDLIQVVTEGTQEPLILAPHDILFVPRTPIANADLWMRQHVTDLLPFFRGTSVPLRPY